MHLTELLWGSKELMDCESILYYRKLEAGMGSKRYLVDLLLDISGQMKGKQKCSDLLLFSFSFS